MTMQIHKGLSGFDQPRGTVVTSGTFDGVHFGHSRILKRTCALAQEHGLDTVVLTFWPHPRTVVGGPKPPVRLLSTLEEKAALLEKMGIDHLVILPFDKSFSEKSTIDYVQEVLINGLNTKHLVIGYDHRFGKNREGSFSFLKDRESEFGFVVEEISRQEVDDVAVSSTKIRKALATGDVRTANNYLGYAYHLTGIVVKGKQLGRTLGYPTANLQVMEKSKLIPQDGVYAVTVSFDCGTYQGMLNIGSRPTVGVGLAQTVEVHIFDFQREVYGEEMSVDFQGFIRHECKFAGLPELKQQLADDERMVKAFFEAEYNS